jgi:hypothetical protein
MRRQATRAIADTNKADACVRLGATVILGKHGGGRRLRESVSGCGIPANRKNNREYHDIWLFRAKLSSVLKVVQNR